ncbi:MAG: acetamidase/formamidase family protein [Eubacteriales bacterium]
MKICNRDVLYTYHSKENKPSMSVDIGEIFAVQTQLCTGDWLQSAGDTWHPDKNRGPNPTNCIEVIGAKKGDILAVDILDIEVDNIGYTGFASWKNPPSQQIYPNEWGILYKVVRIENGEILWSDSLRLPVEPMVGTLGIAPSGDPVSNREAGNYGGNMDIQEVKPGATVYLNVQVDGALLHVGDVHAIMGDGEINRAGGIECRGKVTLRTHLLPGNENFKWVRMEDEKCIMAAAFCTTMEEAFYQATGELIRWMEEAYGIAPQEAYLLLGQVMAGRSTAVVNTQMPYICKIAKKYLPDKRI